MPSNFSPKDPANPYADYSFENLYTFLSGYQLPRDIGSEYEYSNLGGGLLGHTLTLATRSADYETMVVKRVAAPLGMTNTAITLSPAMKSRLAAGHGPTPAGGELGSHSARRRRRTAPTTNDLLTPPRISATSRPRPRRRWPTC